MAKDVGHQISLGSVVAAAVDQVSCDLDGEAVLLSLRTGIYYGLDQVGARIWSLVQSPTPVQVVHDTILAEYDVESSRCEHDLLALLRAMAAEGLIEVRSA